MEPNHNNYTPSAELPQPQEGAGQPTAESRPAQPERASQPPATPAGQQAMQQLTQPQVPQALGANPAGPQSVGSSTSSGTSGLMADDVDLIEKEWVVKAKAIVAQTKDDPYQQNRAMTQVKADYLKKRYNKDLKVNSEN